MLCSQDVANAIGAALGTVSATIDTIEDLREEESLDEDEKEREERVKKARLELVAQVRELAISEAIRKGAVPSKVYIHTEEVVDVSYVANKLRVRVKAIGLLQDSSHMCHRGLPVIEDNPHWPYASAEDRERDNAANLPAPTVTGIYMYIYMYMYI